VDIFLYICIMENEEGLPYWIDIDEEDRYGVFKGLNYVGDLTETEYNIIESVKRLSEVGVHVTFYNRNTTIHNYGK